MFCNSRCLLWYRRKVQHYDFNPRDLVQVLSVTKSQSRLPLNIDFCLCICIVCSLSLFHHCFKIVTPQYHHSIHLWIFFPWRGQNWKPIVVNKRKPLLYRTVKMQLILPLKRLKRYKHFCTFLFNVFAKKCLTDQNVPHWGRLGPMVPNLGSPDVAHVCTDSLK